jgi:tetratricopeptide (TPR) repeat protein
MLSGRLWYVALALTLLAGMAIFAWTNPSYEKGFEAKWYYLLGEYDRAYDLAKEAYELDRYNRMAFTVMTQTAVARRFIDYIKEGEAYLKTIEEIADRPPISDADKIRIKMICEVMMDRYATLTPTKLTDKELVKEARAMYERFKTLHDSIFKGIS